MDLQVNITKEQLTAEFKQGVDYINDLYDRTEESLIKAHPSLSPLVIFQIVNGLRNRHFDLLLKDHRKALKKLGYTLQ